MGKTKTLKSRDYLVDFVRYYKLLPALWNTKCQDYHDRDVRLKSHLLLLRKYRESEPCATLNDLKAKLNTMRSNYRRHLKKVGTTKVEAPFCWWNEMHFINGNEMVESEIDVEASYTELKNDPTFDEEADLTGKRTFKSRECLVEFIRYYKLLPALWNRKCQHYYNRDVRLKAYLLLLKKYREKEPTASLNDVKAKINDLRSNYRRHLKKIGTAEVESNFQWWNEMHFINGNEEVENEIDVEARYAELKKDPCFDEEAELMGHLQHLDGPGSDQKNLQVLSSRKLAEEVTRQRIGKRRTVKSREYLVEFIQYYKLLPALWNSKCQYYYDRNVKQKSNLLLLRKYREGVPRATLGDVKAKINHLKSNFRKLLEKPGTPVAEANSYWINEMHFINGNEEVESEIDVEASYAELKNEPSFDEADLKGGHPQRSDESESDSKDNEWESGPTHESESKSKDNEWRSGPTHELESKSKDNEWESGPPPESERDPKYNEWESKPEPESDSDDKVWESDSIPESESDSKDNVWETESTPTKVYIRVKTKSPIPTPRLIYKDEDMSSNGYIDDEYYCWGKIMVTDLKKMSPVQQLYAKKAIAEILMEGQLGLLHKDSVQINKTPNNE